METKKTFEVIVEPQDILSEEMSSIFGGTEFDFDIRLCIPKGSVITCSPTGNITVPTEPTQNVI